MKRSLAPLGAVALVLGLTAVAACTNDPFDPSSLANRPPVARIFVDHVDSLAPTSYNEARFAWSGSDPDGFVVGFWVSIQIDESVDPTWVFTATDDSVASYETRADGTIVPLLRVVAVDDRGALSDTVSTAFPLFNSPPVVEYQEDFVPPRQSFSAIDLDFFSFDVDGDETLLPYVEYRYEGSDPDLAFDADDSTADATLGWVQAPRPRRGFRLRLRDVPPGDPANGDLQTVYMRVSDDAGASTVFTYTWQVPPVRGSVLLIDDDETLADPRDPFFREVMQEHFGDAWNVIEATSLKGEPEVLQATLGPFDTIVWYVKRQGRGENIEAARDALQRFLTQDRDPGTAGIQTGQLYLDFQYVGMPAQNGGVNDIFRQQVLHVLANPLEGQIVGFEAVASQIGGTLDILANAPTLSDLVYSASGSTTFFDIWPIGVPTDAAPLYRFEQARWNSQRCRNGCQPTVASRWPATGDARVVTISIQLELIDDYDLAKSTLRTLWSDEMGLQALTGGAR